MCEQDKRTPEQIKNMISWIFNDAFWSKTIRSMDKLRLRWNEGKLVDKKNKQIDRGEEEMKKWLKKRKAGDYAG